MTPGAHLLASWLLADRYCSTQRERRLASLVGILPDLDGIGLIIDIYRNNQTEYYATYHHIFCHNLFFGIGLSIAIAALSQSNRIRTFTLSLTIYHMHLLCDLIGSKGPDGYRWPIQYLYPLISDFEISLRWQWLLNGWQNTIILIALFTAAVHISIHKRRSFIEVLSSTLDKKIFLAVGARWPA